jgi:hypothetical protein
MTDIEKDELKKSFALAFATDNADYLDVLINKLDRDLEAAGRPYELRAAIRFTIHSGFLRSRDDEAKTHIAYAIRLTDQAACRRPSIEDFFISEDA